MLCLLIFTVHAHCSFDFMHSTHCLSNQYRMNMSPSSLSPETNADLFTKPTVVFDSTTPLDLHQPEYYNKPGRGTYVAHTLFYLGFQSKKREPSGSKKLYYCTMIVSLGDVYIVNCLHMRGYPGVPDERQKSFSYTVEVSRDKSSWLKLFDYSSFACRSTQDLHFPKQAIR